MAIGGVPLGVVKRSILLTKRVRELARAISEYSEYDIYAEPLQGWILELVQTYEDLLEEG